MYWSVIHGIIRKPHLSVVWNWYHFVAIAILHQPRPTDSADINTRLQLSDTSSIPPMHGGFLLKPSKQSSHGVIQVIMRHITVVVARGYLVGAIFATVPFVAGLLWSHSRQLVLTVLKIIGKWFTREVSFLTVYRAIKAAIRSVNIIRRPPFIGYMLL